MAGVAVAQDSQEQATIYKKHTVFSFEGDTIDGDLRRPDGAYIEARKELAHSNLIKVREDFRQKILESVDLSIEVFMPVPLSLTVFQDDRCLGEHRFERKTVKIGRLASAHLKLTDPRVSRIHAVIEAGMDGLDYSIVDMGSSEGTFLNSHKVTQEKLLSGDELRISNYRVVVAFGNQYKLSTQDIGTGDIQGKDSEDIYADPRYHAAHRTLVGPLPNEIAALAKQFSQENGHVLSDSVVTESESATLLDVQESEVSHTLSSGHQAS